MKKPYILLLAKLRQESTWRGLVALATALGCTIDPVRQSAFVAAGMTIIGLINVLKNK